VHCAVVEQPQRLQDLDVSSLHSRFRQNSCASLSCAVVPHWLYHAVSCCGACKRVIASTSHRRPALTFVKMPSASLCRAVVPHWLYHAVSCCGACKRVIASTSHQQPDQQAAFVEKPIASMCHVVMYCAVLCRAVPCRR
jgi:hypothetical protein